MKLRGIIEIGWICSIIVFSVVVAVSSPALANSYTFSSIDVGRGTFASGINNVGDIVGSFVDQNFQAERGFLKTGDTISFIDVPFISPLNLTSATGINNAGLIVGSFGNFSTIGTQGYLKTGDTITAINVPGALSTSATGINNAGQIVGTHTNFEVLDPATFSFINHGFLKSGGTFSSINVPGAFSTSASGINNAGQIVGNYSDATGGHGFLKSGNTFTSIDFPFPNPPPPPGFPGFPSTSASGINNAGDIVGTYQQFDGFTFSFINHGFLKSGDTFSLIDVPGASSTTPLGINDAGQIVGSFVVAGAGHPGGDPFSHGFLATPVPEPASLLLLGSGLVGMAAWRKKMGSRK